VYSLIFIDEQNLAGVEAAVSVVTLSLLRNARDASRGPLRENATSSTKSELHSPTYRNATERRPQATRIENGEVQTCGFRDMTADSDAACSIC